MVPKSLQPLWRNISAHSLLPALFACHRAERPLTSRIRTSAKYWREKEKKKLYQHSFYIPEEKSLVIKSDKLLDERSSPAPPPPPYRHGSTPEWPFAEGVRASVKMNLWLTHIRSCVMTIFPSEQLIWSAVQLSLSSWVVLRSSGEQWANRRMHCGKSSLTTASKSCCKK